MPTIPADAGSGLGVFDTLPPDCADGADAIKQLSLFVDAHYGWAGPAFIKRIKTLLRTAPGRRFLTRKMRRLLAEFKRRTGISGNDGPADRVADKFALVYAAARLSRHWNVLPVNRVGPAVLTVYRRYRAGLSPDAQPVSHQSALDEVRNYVDRHRSELHDLSRGIYPDLLSPPERRGNLVDAASEPMVDGVWFARPCDARGASVRAQVEGD